MIDIQTISVLVASITVVLFAVYYAIQIRYQSKIQQVDVITRLYSVVTSREYLEAWERVRDRQMINYIEYKEKYGFLELNQVVGVYDEVGVLLERGLVDIDLVNGLFGESVVVVWEKVKNILPMHYPARPPFEYLYNEVKKYQEQAFLLHRRTQRKSTH